MRQGGAAGVGEWHPPAEIVRVVCVKLWRKANFDSPHDLHATLGRDMWRLPCALIVRNCSETQIFALGWPPQAEAKRWNLCWRVANVAVENLRFWFETCSLFARNEGQVKNRGKNEILTWRLQLFAQKRISSGDFLLAISRWCLCYAGDFALVMFVGDFVALVILWWWYAVLLILR